MMTSAVYRLWAKARLGDLKEWQERWADPCMHAGLAGKGADDAWYGTALNCEESLADGCACQVACFDLAKAFDYLNRELLYELLGRAGCPKGVLR
eukprot:7783649-Alexandrium_andersonii.AAC.1